MCLSSLRFSSSSSFWYSRCSLNSLPAQNPVSYSTHTAMGRISCARAPFGRSGLDPELLADRRGVAHRGACSWGAGAGAWRGFEEERRKMQDARRGSARAAPIPLYTNRPRNGSPGTPLPTSLSVTSPSGPVAFVIFGSIFLYRARRTSVRYSVQGLSKDSQAHQGFEQALSRPSCKESYLLAALTPRKSHQRGPVMNSVNNVICVRHRLLTTTCRAGQGGDRERGERDRHARPCSDGESSGRGAMRRQQQRRGEGREACKAGRGAARTC